jgi:hypothetical protein
MTENLSVANRKIDTTATILPDLKSSGYFVLGLAKVGNLGNSA